MIPQPHQELTALRLTVKYLERALAACKRARRDARNRVVFHWTPDYTPYMTPDFDGDTTACGIFWENLDYTPSAVDFDREERLRPKRCCKECSKIKMERFKNAY